MNRIISAKRVIDENLHWKDVQIELEEPYKDQEIGLLHTHSLDMQIIDSDGVVYHGILEDEGCITASGGYCHFDSAKTYEGFGAAEQAGISKRYGRSKTRHYLHYNQKTGEAFGRASHPNVSDEHIYSMNACDVAAWLSDIDNREEPITYETDPRSIAIGFPIEIVNTIERHLPGDAIDWIRCILAEAVGNSTLAGPPVGKSTGDPAFTAEQVKEALGKIKAGEMSPEETMKQTEARKRSRS